MNDKHLEYLLRVKDGIQTEMDTMMKYLDEDNEKFKCLQEQRSLMICIIEQYKRHLQEVSK